MEKKIINNVRLGILVLSALMILVVSLYIIGQNRNYFGSGMLLKARFTNVSGLMPGNNVRFSGIQCGTVRDITIVDDTTVEVQLLVNSKTSVYIRSDARVAIGTEGLIGNKVVNIFPGNATSPRIEDGGMLRTANEKGLDDMIGSLSATGDNARDISADLKETSARINASPVLRQILTDTQLAAYLHRSLANFERASTQLDRAATSVNTMVAGARNGQGVAGVLLEDKMAADNIGEAIAHVNSASKQINNVLGTVDSLVWQIRQDAGSGAGAVHLLLRDTTAATRLSNSLTNIEKGTAAFSEDMEALKHNFLLRGYFRKQTKKNRK